MCTGFTNSGILVSLTGVLQEIRLTPHVCCCNKDSAFLPPVEESSYVGLSPEPNWSIASTEPEFTLLWRRSLGIGVRFLRPTRIHGTMRAEIHSQGIERKKVRGPM